MPTRDTSDTTHPRSGRRFVVRFESDAELRKVKRAAAAAHAAIRKSLGRHFPNTSQFIVEAALEKAARVLGKGDAA